nr:MAG TPA: hypothetical protein [Caudoviricetes sp.]
MIICYSASSFINSFYSLLIKKLLGIFGKVLRCLSFIVDIKMVNVIININSNALIT